MIKLSTSTIVLESQVFEHADVSGSSYWDIYYNHNLGVEPDVITVQYLRNGYWVQRFDFVWWQDTGGGARYYGWDHVSDSTYNTAHIRVYRGGSGSTEYFKVKVQKTI